jgi:hypothetical protein
MTYKITRYTFKQAKKHNLLVKPSTKHGKKIDVYTHSGDFLGSVGAYGYNDYPNYIKKYGLSYANSRRRLYRQRHSRDRKKKYSKGWLADVLLW